MAPQRDGSKPICKAILNCSAPVPESDLLNAVTDTDVSGDPHCFRAVAL